MKKYITFIFLLLVTTIFLLSRQSKNEDFTNNNIETLAIMLQTSAGSVSYEKSSSGEWPTGDYVFNSERSYCENGSSIMWDSTNNMPVITTRYADKCFIYFDIQSESYVYWSTTEGGSGTIYAADAYPSGAKDSYTSLGLSQPGKFIKTTLNGGNATKHEACLYYNNNIFCLEANYWTGTIGTQSETEGINTKNKLKDDMETALGTSATSCTSDTTTARCFFDSGMCNVNFDGRGYCSVSSNLCHVSANDTAYCN